MFLRVNNRLLKNNFNNCKQFKNYFSKMRAVIVKEFGDPSVLKVEETDIPIYNSKQCLIKLHACGVNPVSYNQLLSYNLIILLFFIKFIIYNII